MGRKPNPNKVEKVKNKKEFIEDPALVTLANKCIDAYKLDYLNNVRIRYVLVDSYISKSTIAQCIKASNELKYFGKLDYVVKISKDIYDATDDETRELIMYHELLHILLSTNKSGDMVTKIMPHDIQDFSSLIKKAGVDWIKELRIATTSVRDMDVEKADNIKV
jgi:predicted metallopeptidase